MPEVEFRRPYPFFSEIRKAVNYDWTFLYNADYDKIKKEIERRGGEFVGTGMSYFVLADTNPDRVVALSYQGLTPEQAKIQFYLQRIFHTLYPHNFPKFYAAFSFTDSNGEVISGTIRQRIHESDLFRRDMEKPSSENFHDKYQRVRQKWIHYPFDRVPQELTKWKVDFYMDYEGGNLIVSDNKCEYNIEALAFAQRESRHVIASGITLTADPPYDKIYRNLPNIIAFMENARGGLLRRKRYSDEEINVVKSLINRLRKLGFIK